MLSPANRTSPAVGAYTPVMTLNTEVLPAPFGPITLTTSRSSTLSSSSVSAFRPPNASDNLSSSSTGPGGSAIQTTSTRREPRRPSGRAFIITIRIAPISS